MSSEIILRDAAAPADPDSNLLLRWENTVSTPLLSAAYLENGEAVAGVYTIIGASGSTVNITADDPKNELIGTGLTVVADDATVNEDVLAGVGLVFSSSLATGWTAKVAVGALMASDGGTSQRLNVGIIEAGSISTQRRIAAVNVGSEDSAETFVYGLPGYFVEGTDVEQYIKNVANHSSPSRHDLATPGDFVIAFADYQTGPPQTADVLVDTVKAIEDAKLDGAELYEHGTGNGYIDGVDKFKGLGIIFEDLPGDPTAKSFNLHVRGSYDWYEFAPDVTGSPGTWQAPPLQLTESGEVAGVITASGLAYFWVRVNVPSSATPGDMRLANLRVRGLSI
jgi:hypothetical protein